MSGPPRIPVIHGPRLNLIGSRDPSLHDSAALADIDERLRKRAAAHGAELHRVPTDLEGEIAILVQQAAVGHDDIVIDPGGASQPRIAIRDALDASRVPAVEVQLSNLYARGPFRHTSLTAARCVGVIGEFGPRSYELGLDAALAHVEGLGSS